MCVDCILYKTVIQFLIFFKCFIGVWCVIIIKCYDVALASIKKYKKNIYKKKSKRRKQQKEEKSVIRFFISNFILFLFISCEFFCVFSSSYFSSYWCDIKNHKSTIFILKDGILYASCLRESFKWMESDTGKRRDYILGRNQESFHVYFSVFLFLPSIFA